MPACVNQLNAIFSPGLRCSEPPHAHLHGQRLTIFQRDVCALDTVAAGASDYAERARVGLDTHRAEYAPGLQFVDNRRGDTGLRLRIREKRACRLTARVLDDRSIRRRGHDPCIRESLAQDRLRPCAYLKHMIGRLLFRNALIELATHIPVHRETQAKTDQYHRRWPKASRAVISAVRGGTRQFQYRLEAGQAGWKLVCYNVFNPWPIRKEAKSRAQAKNSAFGRQSSNTAASPPGK